MRRYSIPNGVDPFLLTSQMILVQKNLLSFDDCGRTMVKCMSVHLRSRSVCRWKSKNQWFLCNWTDFLKTQRLSIFLYDHRKVLWQEILVAMTWGSLKLWKYETFVERAHKTETNHGPKLSELDTYPKFWKKTRLELKLCAYIEVWNQEILLAIAGNAHGLQICGSNVVAARETCQNHCQIQQELDNCIEFLKRKWSNKHLYCYRKVLACEISVLVFWSVHWRRKYGINVVCARQTTVNHCSILQELGNCIEFPKTLWLEMKLQWYRNVLSCEILVCPAVNIRKTGNYGRLEVRAAAIWANRCWKLQKIDNYTEYQQNKWLGM